MRIDYERRLIIGDWRLTSRHQEEIDVRELGGELGTTVTISSEMIRDASFDIRREAEDEACLEVMTASYDLSSSLD